MLKQIISGTVLLSLIVTSGQLSHTPVLASDLNKAEDSIGKEFRCGFTLGTIQGFNKCRLSVIQQELIIDVKGEVMKVPLGQIFALSSTTQRSGDGSVSADMYIGFITQPDHQTGNRTNFFYVWTKHERDLFALQEGMTTQVKTASRISFSETVPVQISAPENKTEISKQVEQLLKTKTCIRCDLRSANLESTDLKNANLEGANLQGANLSGVNLENAYLIGANLDGAKMTKANLNDAILIRASMLKVNLENSRLEVTNLQGANLAQSILHNAKLGRGDKSYVNLNEADLSGADLSGANLAQANLQNANLQGASLNQTNAGGAISSTNLYSANLRGANLSNASLIAAVLLAADLRDTTLSKADLRRADFRYANLQKANLEGANLKGTDFKDANLCLTTMSDGKPSTQICAR